MLSISLASRLFKSTGKKTGYQNVIMHRKDSFILGTGFLTTFAVGYRIIIDESLDWKRIKTFSPELALI
jgi:hypothetical protein